jgi:splicing factor, arginine/serine-rich 11
MWAYQERSSRSDTWDKRKRSRSRSRSREQQVVRFPVVVYGFNPNLRSCASGPTSMQDRAKHERNDRRGRSPTRSSSRSSEPHSSPSDSETSDDSRRPSKRSRRRSRSRSRSPSKEHERKRSSQKTDKGKGRDKTKSRERSTSRERRKKRKEKKDKDKVERRSALTGKKVRSLHQNPGYLLIRPPVRLSSKSRKIRAIMREMRIEKICYSS